MIRLIQLEGYITLATYIAHMHQPHMLFDTPVLLAASSLYRLQCACFVGSDEPTILLSPELAASSDELPLALITNIGNKHLYATVPDVQVLSCVHDTSKMAIACGKDPLLAVQPHGFRIVDMLMMPKSQRRSNP